MHNIMLLCLIFTVLLGIASSTDPGKVLILGGQGLAGSATFTTLSEASYHVSLLNNNKNYYDYLDLVDQTPNSETIVCSRPASLSGCFELQNFLTSNGKVTAVVDFTSSSAELMSDALSVLGALNPDVYVFVSSAAVYDVSANTQTPVREEDGRRAEDEATRQYQNGINEFGNKMLAAEEVLVASGIPYVILRCGDLIGPRDTTYRWWQYQVWAEHFSLIGAPFPIYNNLANTAFSLTYGADVAQAILRAIQLNKVNKVYNIAMDKTFTLPHLLLELCIHFNTDSECYADFTDGDDEYTLYPSNHMGLLSLELAQEELDFVPSSWEHVLASTVQFYEGARSRFTDERDTVLKRLNENVVPYLRVGDLNSVVTRVEDRRGGVRTEL